MERTHKVTARRKIPDTVLQAAIDRLKAKGFSRAVESQARYMIEDTTEVVTALGGRIVWGR